MSPPDVGGRLALLWLGWYTRRLPASLAQERRAEIVSDLWDQRADALAGGQGDLGRNLDVVRRVLAGAPDDILWRHAAVRRATSEDARSKRGVTMFNNPAGRWMVSALAVLGMATVVGLFAAFGLDVDGLAGGARLVGSAALATALFLGLGLRTTHRAGSTPLLLVGAAAPVVAWYTLPLAYVLSLVLVLVVWTTRPRMGSPVT